MDKRYNGYNPGEYSDEVGYRRSRPARPSSSRPPSRSTPSRVSSGSRSTHSAPPRSNPYQRNASPAAPQHRSAPSNYEQSTPHRRSSSNVSQRAKKRQSKAKKNQRFKSFISGFLVVAIVMTIISTGIFVGMYAAVMTEIQDMNIDTLVKNHSSYAYYTDKSGTVQELQVLNTSDSSVWLESNEISDYAKMAAVAIEDERFYKHNGIDIKRTLGATVKFGLSKIGIGDSSYGGSTITQQVVKNITKEKDKSATRKVKEILRAIALEKECSKDEILTLYLNIVYFANNCTGIESAAQLYYGKPASQLNLPEAAAIIGITQIPAKFDPYAHPENTVEKRNVVLGKMYELKMISKEEYESAKAADLGVIEKRSRGESNIMSYFLDQVVLDVVNDLQDQKGYSKEFAEQQIFNGGFQIYTTIDPDIQNTLENIYNNPANFPNNGAQSAIVIMDPYTGEIKGLVGGIGQKTARGLNRATQSRRQPGSAIKPISVYAPAIEYDKLSASSVLRDEKLTIGNDGWEPKNSYRGFKGDMILPEAIGRSANIPAVKGLETLGISKSYNFMTDKLDMKLVNEDKNYSSLALGGLTKGFTVEEMAAAYCIFPNGGNYIKPHTYTKVIDSTGNVILENSSKGKRAISEHTAYIMTDLLSHPVESSYGTARSAQLDGIDAYGKTGTTSDNYDKWFVGFTPNYVGAVWYGYDQNKAISASTNPATAIWKKVMTEIHAGERIKTISEPHNIEKAWVCTKTGNLEASFCNGVEVYFKPGTVPEQKCTGHRGYSSSDDDDDDDDDDDNKKSTPSPSKSPKPTAEATKKPEDKPVVTPNPQPKTEAPPVQRTNTPAKVE